MLAASSVGELSPFPGAHAPFPFACSAGSEMSTPEDEPFAAMIAVGGTGTVGSSMQEFRSAGTRRCS